MLGDGVLVALPGDEADLAERAGDALVVAVAGGTGCGKSSIVNALVGSPVAATGVVRPTTDRSLAVMSPAPHVDLDPLLEAEVWADARNQVAAGRQAYVVCPLIGESEKLEVASAEETFERLAADELAGLRLGLLHGRLTSAEKEATMEAFRSGDLDVLVATTVIEVGVDVSNATVMVILDAGRFGIAQLHQLRGRVGRGAHASTCWLAGEATTPYRERLEYELDVIVRTGYAGYFLIVWDFFRAARELGEGIVHAAAEER